MNDIFVRIFEKLSLNDIKEHLLIYGDVSGLCAHCQATDVKLNDRKCPKCSTEFKYIAFRHVKNHMPKVRKISAERPGLKIIDHDDFARAESANRAREFLK